MGGWRWRRRTQEMRWQEELGEMEESLRPVQTRNWPIVTRQQGHERLAKIVVDSLTDNNVLMLVTTLSTAKSGAWPTSTSLQTVRLPCIKIDEGDG